MASEDCPGENSTQIWTAINRIVVKIHGDDIGEIDGVSPKARITKEFSEIFRNSPRRLVPNEGINRGIAFPPTPANRTIEGRSNEVVMTSAASSISSSASIVEPITASTEAPTSTVSPTKTSIEVSPTTSTGIPTTTSNEAPITSATKAPATRTTGTAANSTKSGIQFPTVTEIALAGDGDVETARRLNEESLGTFLEENPGPSVAMPLFAIIVLLAITSAVAVFTVARARDVHRKTFIIGKASPDEINDIVVLGSDDVSN